jgi:uncharacterized protein (TIGR03382 family)
MTRLFAITAAVSTMGMVGIAHAEAPRRATYQWTDPSRIGATWTAPAPAGVSHVIFLNNCQPSGCTLNPGNDDSTQNTSSIPSQQAHISAYSGSASEWSQILSCVRQTYAPFNVQIVDTRPASGDYHMAIVAGSASEAGMGQGVLGVSPFSCGYIPNSISFSFANEEPSNILDMCWTVSQETAHSWGLDHKFDDKSPMTYLQQGPAMKTFQDTAMSCGEYSARQCNCTYAVTGSAQENDYQLVLATFGSSAPDTTPPTVSISSPKTGAVVMSGFTITADINDSDGFVASAQLKIDGTAVGSPLTAAPWTWTAPTTLGTGAHHVEVDALDGGNNPGSAAIDVTIGGQSCSGNSCPMGQVCSMGTCIGGSGTPGGLGSPCMTNGDCSSNQCASDSTGQKYCVVSCNPAMSGCPSGFGCVATGGTNGVCWPNGDNGKGGCSTSGGDGAFLLALGALGALLITRRRK